MNEDIIFMTYVLSRKYLMLFQYFLNFQKLMLQILETLFVA